MAFADNRTWWIPWSMSGSLNWLHWNEVDFFQDPLWALWLWSSNEQSPFIMVGCCILATAQTYKWNSCLAQLHLLEREWTNSSPLFNNWDDAEQPLYLTCSHLGHFLLAGIAMSSWRGSCVAIRARRDRCTPRHSVPEVSLNSFASDKSHCLGKHRQRWWCYRQHWLH